MSDGEFISVDRARLFVRRFGDPALPMLIVVHGGPTWDHTYLLSPVTELADQAHVVLFDLRGCGRSSRTPPIGDLPLAALQPDQLADDVAALIRHYGAARADVLGFSYGGGIAMRVIDQHPGLVRMPRTSPDCYARVCPSTLSESSGTGAARSWSCRAAAR